MVGICQLEDLVLVFFKQGVVEEDIFGQEGFTGPGLFGGFVEQDVLVNDDADIAGKDEVGNGCKQHAPGGHRAADECRGESDRIKLKEFFLGIIGAAFDGTDGGDQFQPDLVIFEDVSQKPLQFYDLVGAKEFLVAGFVKGAPVVGVIDFAQSAADLVRIQKI